jgi:hypothetical protein
MESTGDSPMKWVILSDQFFIGQKTVVAMADIDLELTRAEKAAILNGCGHLYRDRPMGKAGDLFSIQGKRFEIIDVSQRTLETVANNYYSMEGFTSPCDFMEAWKTGRPGRWEPEKRVYVHWFRLEGTGK